MGIWYDQKVGNDFSFITLKEKVSHFNIGLVRSPYQAGTLHKYTSKNNTFLLAIDGEIENISSLSLQLGLTTEENAEVIHTLYRQEGPEGLYRIQGTASIILFDLENKRTILYRSFLKGNPLYFTNKNTRLTVCTNPVFLLHRDDLSNTIDKEKIVNIFGIAPLSWTGTVFSEIDEVAHGEVVTISSKGLERNKQLLKNIFHSRYTYENEDMAFTKYRSMFESVVNESIEADKKYGIMLSSGIDSTSIAYYAAKKLRSQGKELVAYSWTLPGDHADESENIRLICDELNIPLKMFNGEKFGPFDELNNPFLIPDTPFVNSFWPINKECYRRASADGVDLLFNGNFADLLFKGGGSLLQSIWRDRRFDLLLLSIVSLIKSKGFLGFMRLVWSKVLSSKKDNTSQPMPWLTEKVTRLKNSNMNNIVEKEFKYYQVALSPFQSGYLGGERYLSGPYNLYRAEPHRNLTLMEYSLGFPYYMTYRDGKTKFFVRKAMHGLLPDKILQQPRVGRLGSFVLKSFYRNIEIVREKIWEDPSSWNYYVKEKWMREKLKDGAEVDNKDLYVIWLCINLTAWLKAIKPGGSLYEGKFK